MRVVEIVFALQKPSQQYNHWYRFDLWISQQEIKKYDPPSYMSLYSCHIANMEV